MKRSLSIFLLFCAVSARAQWGDEPSSLHAIKVGAGYTYEFPGLAGYTVSGEFARAMTPNLEGALGVKRVNVSGHPRTSEIKEFTKATTLDFSLYFLPLRQGNHIIRVGGGYSFSFYHIRRSYPEINRVPGESQTTSWKVQESEGRISGFNLAGEYEYLVPYSSFSLGLRGSLFKPYTQVLYFGPFAAVRF